MTDGHEFPAPEEERSWLRSMAIWSVLGGASTATV
jgi:hypothetical protein